jgi:hypothetical protein
MSVDYVLRDIGATIYPSGLCLVIENLLGFSSQISDRNVKSIRTSRDIVSCRLQAVQEGNESVAEWGPVYIAAHSVTLQTTEICCKRPSGARDRPVREKDRRFDGEVRAECTAAGKGALMRLSCWSASGKTALVDGRSCPNTPEEFILRLGIVLARVTVCNHIVGTNCYPIRCLVSDSVARVGLNSLRLTIPTRDA